MWVQEHCCNLDLMGESGFIGVSGGLFLSTGAWASHPHHEGEVTEVTEAACWVL